ncbi:10356_t:CDS:1, partial [Funneliformis geosporum]
IVKSKQSLIAEQQNQIRENNLLLGQLGSVGLFVQLNRYQFLA